MNSSKQEPGHDTNNSKFSSSRTTPSSSRQSWAGFKNPRIVRVSRSFGGKDRHSKVCTIRGLRDRRIRLSVPTAIQLYDLQERLGLSQPSKVVDWLLDATKDDIDKLPPLHFPPASVSHLFNPSTPCMKDGVKICDNFDGNMREKSTLGGKDKWFASSDHEQENQEGTNIGGYVPLVSSQNLFQLGNQSSLPAGMYNTMPFTSNLSLAPFGNNSFSSQTENCHQNNNLPISLASSNSFPSGSQLYFCQNGTTLSSIVPQYMTTNNSQFNHFHFLNSSSPLVPTLQLISSKGLNSQEDQDDHDNHLPHKEGIGSYHLKKL